MILNDIVAILQYQITKKQSSTQICQWKTYLNNTSMYMKKKC